MQINRLTKYNYQGSNQYVKRSKTTRLNIFILISFLVIALALIVGANVRRSLEPIKILSPLGNSFDFDRGQAYAAELINTYTVPSLNPNETEREQNIGLIKKIWGQDADTGLGIAKCESGYRTLARNVNTNNTVDQGVFQVNSVHGMPEMDNAVSNISYAYTLFVKQGTNPWTSSESCWGK